MREVFFFICEVIYSLALALGRAGWLGKLLLFFTFIPIVFLNLVWYLLSRIFLKGEGYEDF